MSKSSAIPQRWVVLRLDDQDRVIEFFEYDDMEEARESFDEEIQDLGHSAALMPAWVWESAEAGAEQFLRSQHQQPTNPQNDSGIASDAGDIPVT